jgi:hypothetical protein
MKDWAVLVYMAGDNNLESAAEANLFEMLLSGFSDRVAVVVQLDSRRSGTRRFVMESGSRRQIGETMPGTNTGDPAVLSAFIRWAADAFPARQRMLVIWGHGTGWDDVPDSFDWDRVRGRERARRTRGSLFRSTLKRAHDGRAEAQSRAVALDATSQDFLDNDELRQGLADALDGGKLDVLAFDGCLMAMIEVAYHLRDQARYLVASQEAELALGWPYAAIIDALCDEPHLSARALSARIVDAYGQSADGVRAATRYTLSALDLAQIPTTAELIRALAERLADGYPSVLTVRRAVDEASSRAKGAKRFQDEDSVDLYDWAWRMRRLYAGPDERLQAALDALLAHLAPGAADGLVVATAAEMGTDRDRVHGVSIYVPLRRQASALYDALDFARTGWGTFAHCVGERLG